MTLRRLAPGIYDDGHGGCHIDARELLEASGFADTPWNRAMLLQAAAALGREKGLAVIITRDIHRGDPAR